MLSVLVTYLVVMNLLGVSFLGLVVYSVARGYLNIEFSLPVKHVTEMPDEHVDELEQLTPLELERVREMQLFDQRVANMKDELARANFKEIRQSPIVAEESDGVKNLPHHAVDASRSIIGDEVAE